MPCDGSRSSPYMPSSNCLYNYSLPTNTITPIKQSTLSKPDQFGMISPIGLVVQHGEKFRECLMEIIHIWSFLRKYLQIQKYYQMSLLRKNTMPEGPMPFPPKKSQFRSKACSQINLFQLGNHLFASGASCKNGRTVGKRGKPNGGCPSQEKPLTKEDMERIVSKNTLTVNFSNRNAINALPALTTFDKIKGILIKKPLFERFKEFNKENGTYREELEELSREDELQRSRSNIQTQFKLASQPQFPKKERKSVSLISHQSSSSLLRRGRLQRISQESCCKGFKMSRLPSKNCDLDTSLTNSSISYKSKWKTVQKLQDITQACSQACEDDHIERSINLFAKFSQKMGEGLLRKSKRLQKVFQYHV